MPLKWVKIKNHQNKILFLRGKESGYHGENSLNENEYLYKEIILTSPKVNDLEDIRNKYNLEDLSKYDYLEDIKKLGIFPTDKSPQVGLISYVYILNNFKYNKIYLIVFTNDYKNGTWEKHSKDIEQKFYLNELNKGFLIKIDF